MIEVSKAPKDNVSITIPISLLAILDLFCRDNELERSLVITKAIRTYLANEKAKDLSFWDEEYQKLQSKGKI